MTIEELSIRITAEAEGALEMLDAITQRLERLEGLLQLRLSMDADGLSEAAGQLSTLSSAQRDTTRRAQECRNAIQGMISRLDQLGRTRSAVTGLRDLQRQLDRDVRSADDIRDSLKRAGEAMKDGVRSALLAEDGFENMGDSFGDAGASIHVNAQSIYGALGGLISWANQAAGSLNISGSVSVETGGAIGALNQLIETARIAQSILAGLGVAAGGAAAAGGGGGGGGGGGISPEEEAARAAEEARQEALRLDYEQIEHQRHMNEITLEEELALLEEIRRKHQMTAEEIMDWEEKVYDVQQEIRRRDEEELNRLTEGVVDALTAKYEAMRDAELNRLEESRSAWESWRDDSVRAIEDQIAALDRLAQAEEREDQDAEELRRIEKLRQDIAYEQDDYNRAQLEKQLEEAVADREKRLRRQELEDRKAALEEEAELVRQQAEEEMSKLDDQEAAIEAAYEQRLTQAALEAEAEKLILAGNQQEILTLLESFAPGYDQLGRTLGERLLSGFESTVGNVAGWFESLTGQLEAAQDGIARSAVSTAGQGGAQLSGGSRSGQGISIQQTVNFNQPVESPGDLARRMESVNQMLGEWMSQEG